MLGMHRFNTVINLFVNVFLCLELCTFVLYKQKMLAVEPFLIQFIMAFSVGYIVGDLIPLMPIGNKFASIFGLKQNKSFFFFPMSTFMIAVIMTTFMSVIMTFLNIGFAPFFLQAWWGLFPYLLVMAYVTELICVPIAIKLAVKLTSGGANMAAPQ